MQAVCDCQKLHCEWCHKVARSYPWGTAPPWAGPSKLQINTFYHFPPVASSHAGRFGFICSIPIAWRWMFVLFIIHPSIFHRLSGVVVAAGCRVVQQRFPAPPGGSWGVPKIDEISPAYLDLPWGLLLVERAWKISKGWCTNHLNWLEEAQTALQAPSRRLDSSPHLWGWAEPPQEAHFNRLYDHRWGSERRPTGRSEALPSSSAPSSPQWSSTAPVAPQMNVKCIFLIFNSDLGTLDNQMPKKALLPAVEAQIRDAGIL